MQAGTQNFQWDGSTDSGRHGSRRQLHVHGQRGCKAARRSRPPPRWLRPRAERDARRRISCSSTALGMGVVPDEQGSADLSDFRRRAHYLGESRCAFQTGTERSERRVAETSTSSATTSPTRTRRLQERRGEFADVFAASLGGGASAQRRDRRRRSPAVEQHSRRATSQLPTIRWTSRSTATASSAWTTTARSTTAATASSISTSTATSSARRQQGDRLWRGRQRQHRHSDARSDPGLGCEHRSRRSTSTLDIGLNLDSRATPPATAPFNPTDPTSYNFSTSMQRYDSLGNPHALTTYYVNTGPARGTSTARSTDRSPTRSAAARVCRSRSTSIQPAR